jgi:O-antigen/teichoic acid export membrane protein
MGAQGAAIAFSAGETVVTVLAYLMLRRAQPTLRLSLRVPARVALAAAAGAALLLVPGVSSVIAMLAGCSIYVALLIALRAVPPELYHAFSRRAAAPPS